MPIEKIVPDAVTDENSVFTFSGASNNLHLALDEDDTNYVNCAGSDVGGSFDRDWETINIISIVFI